MNIPNASDNNLGSIDTSILAEHDFHRHSTTYSFIEPQNKSYLHINDCIDAILIGLEKAKNHVEIYNIDSEDQIDVKMIAQIVIEEMGLKNVKLTYTGGVDGGRGWKGNAENMLLDITKLKTLGWKPELNTKQAITKAIKYLITELL